MNWSRISAWLIIIGLAVLTLLTFAGMFGSRPAQAEMPQCQVATEKYFIEKMQGLTPPPTILEADPEVLLLFLAKVNRLRAKQNLWLLEADRMVIGRMAHGIGVALFKDGCVVPGSITVVTPQYLAEMGLEPEGFKPI
jgi:hypothetical protein